MSLRNIHLRKLLRLIYSAPNARISALRNDIREEIAKEQGLVSGGADFYGPFWADAKEHVLGVSDLTEATASRIEANAARANLYPRLRDGFLLWWDERRRWTNEPFRPIEAPKGRYRFQSLDATIKVENFLSVRDGLGDGHYVYPYFAPDPALQDEGIRLGLWAIGRAVPYLNWDEMRILDVIRGQTYAVDRTPLVGNEEVLFTKRYEALLTQWEKLRSEYN
jgi:hypothetical protein